MAEIYEMWIKGLGPHVSNVFIRNHRGRFFPSEFTFGKIINSPISGSIVPNDENEGWSLGGITNWWKSWTLERLYYK